MLTRLAAAAQIIIKGTLPASAAAQAWLAGNDNTGGDELTYPYKHMVWLYSAVRAAARSIAQVPLRFYDDAGNELPPTHPVVKLFSNVNPRSSRYQLIEGTVVYLKLSGEAIWVFDPLVRGIPSAIYMPDPTKFGINLTADRRSIVSYTMRDGARDVTFVPKEIMHVKQFNPYDELRGLSDVSALQLTLSGQLGASNYNAEFFTNGTVIGTLLKQTGVAAMTPDQVERLRQQFESRHSGRGKAHKPAVLPPGIEAVQGVSQKDIEFLQYIKLTREEICAATGTNLAMLGVVEDVNKANGEVQERNFWKLCGCPIMSALEDKLRTDFFERFGVRGYAKFDRSSIGVLAEDLTRSIDNALKLWKMGLPLAEINRRLNLQLDETAIAAAEEAAASREAAAAAASAAFAAEPEAAPAKSHAVAQVERKAADKSAARSAVWKRYVAAWQPVENAYRDKLRAYFFDLRKEVLRNIDRLGSGKAVKAADGDDPMDVIVFDLERARKRAGKISVPFFARAAGAGAGTLTQYGWSFNWRTNERVQRFMRMKEQRITEIANTQDAMLRAKLTRTIEGYIAAAAENGTTMTVAQAIADATPELRELMADSTRESFNFAGSRAVTIARTEVGQAVSFARFEGMAENEVERVEWLTADDEGVRGNDPKDEFDHAACDGVVVKLGDKFPCGLTMPGDPSGDAGNVINCRCTLVPAEGEINV